MGGSELDFREAVMGPGVTELQIFAVCGGVEVVVPPGLNVESHGIAIMGGFEH
jgi:predicted membrane protein